LELVIGTNLLNIGPHFDPLARNTKKIRKVKFYAGLVLDDYRVLARFAEMHRCSAFQQVDLRNHSTRMIKQSIPSGKR
jgi:hypothetical protein